MPPFAAMLAESSFVALMLAESSFVAFSLDDSFEEEPPPQALNIIPATDNKAVALNNRAFIFPFGKER